jgi:hypothetical protein
VVYIIVVLFQGLLMRLKSPPITIVKVVHTHFLDNSAMKSTHRLYLAGPYTMMRTHLELLNLFLTPIYILNPIKIPQKCRLTLFHTHVN